MQNKKVIILVVLAVVAILSLLYGIVAPPKSKYAASSRIDITCQENILPSSTAVTVKRRAARTRFTSWGRNPFALKGAPQATPSQTFDLGGIMWNEKNPKAMIGDAVVGKGGKIGSNTVVDIKKDRVILNDGTKDFEIKLKE